MGCCLSPCRNSYENVAKAKTADFQRRLKDPQVQHASIDEFTINGVLGEGTYGRVLHVSRRPGTSHFALKQLSRARAGKRNIDFVKRERQILAAVDFPFIIKLFWCCKDNAYLYFVTELAPCGNFRRFIYEYHIAKEARRFYIGQMVLALEYLHSASVIHRDIKPANILVGADGYLKLSDFGLSKHLRGVQRTYSVLGTPFYRAPEVSFTTGYGCSADWWSLGLVASDIVSSILPLGSEWLDDAPTVTDVSSVTCPRSVLIGEDIRLFVKDLLKEDPTQRLGIGANGTPRARDHVFFSSMDWLALYEKKCVAPVSAPRAVLPQPYDSADDNSKQSTDIPFEKEFAFF